MAWSRINNGSSVPGAGTTMTVTLPSVTVGNFVVIGLLSNNNVTINSVVDTAGNSYAQAGSYITSAAGTVSIWYKYNAAGIGSTNTITVTFASDAGGGEMVAAQYSGGGTGTLDTTASGTGTSANPASASFATALANELIFSFVGSSLATANYTAGSGYTNVVNPDGYTSSEEQLTNSAGSGKTVVFTGASTTWSLIAAAFKASAAADVDKTFSPNVVVQIEPTDKTYSANSYVSLPRQRTSIEGSAVTSLAATFIKDILDTSLIVVAVRNSTAGTLPSSITDSQGNTYVQAVTASNTLDGHNVSIWYARNAKPGLTIVTVNFAASNAHPWIAILEYPGMDTVVPLDATSSLSDSTASTVSPANLTTTLSNDILVSILGGPATTAWTATVASPAGIEEFNQGNAKGYCGDSQVGAAGVYSHSYTTTAARSSVALAAFKRNVTANPTGGVGIEFSWPSTAWPNDIPVTGPATVNKSFNANLVVQVDQDKTFSPNVIVQIEPTDKTFSPNVIVQLTQDKTFSPNVIVQIEPTDKSFSPNIDVQVDIDKSFSPNVDVQADVDKSFSPNIFVQDLVDKTFSPSVYVFTTDIDKSYTVNAFVQDLVDKTFLPSIDVQADVDKSFSPNVVVQIEPVDKSFSPNVVVQIEPNDKSYSPNVDVQVDIDKTFSPNIDVQADIDKTFSPNVYVVSDVDKTFSPNVFVQDLVSKSYSPNAVVQQDQSLTFGVNVDVQTDQSATYNANAIVQIEPTDKSYSPQAFVQDLRDASFQPSVVVQIQAVDRSYSANSVVQVDTQLSYNSNVHVQTDTDKQYLVNVYVRADQDKIFLPSIDVQADVDKTYNVGVVIQQDSIVSFSPNLIVVFGTQEVDFILEVMTFPTLKVVQSHRKVNAMEVLPRGTTKKPLDTRNLVFDFSSPVGSATILTRTVTCVNRKTGEDTSYIISTINTVGSTIVLKVQNGILGEVHDITVVITTSDGQTLQANGYLVIN